MVTWGDGPVITDAYGNARPLLEQSAAEYEGQGQASPEVTVYIDGPAGEREVRVPTIYHHAAAEVATEGLQPGECITATYSQPGPEIGPKPEAEAG